MTLDNFKCEWNSAVMLPNPVHMGGWVLRCAGAAAASSSKGMFLSDYHALIYYIYTAMEGLAKSSASKSSVPLFQCLKFRIKINSFYYPLDSLSSFLFSNVVVTLNFHMPYIHMMSKTNEKLFLCKIMLHLISLFLGKIQALRKQPQWNEMKENQSV